MFESLKMKKKEDKGIARILILLFGSRELNEKRIAENESWF